MKKCKTIFNLCFGVLAVVPAASDAQTIALQPKCDYWTSVDCPGETGLLELFVVGSKKSDNVVSAIYSCGAQTDWRLYPQLRHLVLYQTTITADLIRSLNTAEKIDTIEIESCLFQRGALGELPRIGKLRYLAIEEDRGRKIEDWEFISKLDQLSVLDVSSPALSGDSVRQILRCKTLNELSLPVVKATDDDLSGIRRKRPINC